MHYVYILRCADECLYIGETGDSINEWPLTNRARPVRSRVEDDQWNSLTWMNSPVAGQRSNENDN